MFGVVPAWLPLIAILGYMITILINKNFSKQIKFMKMIPLSLICLWYIFISVSSVEMAAILSSGIRALFFVYFTIEAIIGYLDTKYPPIKK